MAHAARGMFAFIATEKDCVDAEGEEEECVICFEEYESGDRMARLVCWCKFHEVSLSLPPGCSGTSISGSTGLDLRVDVC
jgi:hypothetical protein